MMSVLKGRGVSFVPLSPRATEGMWRKLAVVTGLAAVGFVAPLLDIYGRNPEVFVANRSSVTQIVLFGVGVALFVPLVALAVLAVGRLIGGRGPRVAFTAIVVALAAATGLVVSRQVLPDATLLATAVALAVAALVFWLVRSLDTVFVFAALAVPVLLVMFLTGSATAGLIWTGPDTESDQDAVDVGEPAHLVMIQLDEFPLATIVEPDGTINEKLFPSFDRLADTGTWYRNALSDSIATTQSVPAALTGRRGGEDESPTYLDHPDNLFTLLDGAYEMHVIEWVAEMCPEETCPDYAGRDPARFASLLGDVSVVYGHLTLPGSLRQGLPSIDNAWAGFLGQGDDASGAAVDVPGVPVPPGDEKADWIDWVQRLSNGVGDGPRPILSYAHLRAPHVPWEVNPSGTHYQRPEEYTEVAGVEGDGRWGERPEPSILAFQRHMYQTGFLDTMLGRLMDAIEAGGTWDDTMLIVVADHGASFVPGEHRRWPYEDNRDDLYRVPMFVKYPGQGSGATIDLPAFGLDLLPTVVDSLDIDTDWEFDGVSLRELDEVRPHQPIPWCCNTNAASTDVGVLFDQVERNRRWVPDQSSWLGVASAGSDGNLVGTPVVELDLEELDGFRWSLDLGSTLADVDERSGMVQTVITGRIQLPDEVEADHILMVLNDVVAGVAYISRDTVGGGSISGLVAEELVKPGENQLDLLIADGAGRYLSGTSADLTLDLVAPDGHAITVGPEGGRRIQVDAIEPTDEGWELRGWAADVAGGAVPDSIYVFAGDVVLFSGSPNEENRNVVGWFDDEGLLNSGFKVEVSAGDVPDGLDRLLVVAEFGDRAVADPVTIPR